MIYHHCSVVPCQHSETWRGQEPWPRSISIPPRTPTSCRVESIRDKEIIPLLTFNESLSEILAKAIAVLSNQGRKWSCVKQENLLYLLQSSLGGYCLPPLYLS